MIVSKKHRAIILKLKNPDKIKAVIPAAKELQVGGKKYIAVKHGLDEVKVLRNVGINAPAPMMYYYDWPGRFTPFAAQRIAAGFMSMNERCYNLSEMGVGKTLAALWAFDYLRSIGRLNKAIIVSPLSTLERTWADEVFQHFPHLTAAVLHGSRDKRFKLLAQDVDIYLINHDGIKVKGLAEAIAARKDIDLLIIDELSQAARNASTDRARALKRVSLGRSVWGMTGTPTPNAPTDAWAQCRIVTPERVSQYFNRFRDSVMRQVGPFLWLPRPNATDVVYEAMQPSIRFTRDECVDLPPCMYETRQAELTSEQMKAYKEMLHHLKTEVAAGEVTAVNEAVKAQKLIQIACLAAGTLVLTRAGWRPIESIHASEDVWDGEDWVKSLGCFQMGTQHVIECDGVWMTPDHKVLTSIGWNPAEEVFYGDASTRPSRSEVRIPDGYQSSRIDLWGGDMELQMRLRDTGGAQEPVPPVQVPTEPSKLWVLPWEHHARYGRYTAVQRVVKDESSLYQSVGQGLEKLRRARSMCVRTMEGLYELLLRPARWICSGALSRENRQQRALRPRKLSMGNREATGEQSPNQQIYPNSMGGNDYIRGRPEGWTKTGNSISSDTGRTGGRPVAVFDLVECGPRNRFVVLGDSGPMVVHNCGVAYGSDGDRLALPAGPRLQVVQEICEEASGKILVFVPFVASIAVVAEHLRSCGISVEVVHGGTSKDERNRIFLDFQKTPLPRVIVAQPATLSHGVTLTAASTIVWYAPVTSADTFEQANARITRPGQKNHQFIIMVEGTDIERKYYQRLKEKQRVQGVLLDMVRDARVPA